eukprot:CAMPEP_0184485378 /NCGR_PEP_ID=MMETSP0113_2-20130426/6993_1 /TAXON_ID=91329 /ORGANISM="Norrisiella sphaerica, Strain BC52" /LENGTH=1225 /DNA_ID=CAMNT_0026866797 /DNA_START=99 /DNA_END=3776 /DNA_ORIENTATION=-
MDKTSSNDVPVAKTKRKKRVIVVRRKREGKAPEGKKVLAARPVKAEKAPREEDGGNGRTRNTSYGPQRDSEGNILDHTLLGSIEDFKLEEARLKGSDAKKTEQPEEVPTISRRGMVERMREELEKARVEEEKQRKKALKRLNPADARQYTKKERIQKKWDARTKAWERERLRMAKKLGRDPDQLIMNVTDEKRAHDEEMLDLDQVTLPVEKYGVAAWEMTLRGGTTRVAHVGDYFSGLTTQVPLNAKNREYVRKSSYLLEKAKEKVGFKESLKGTKLFKTKSQRTWKDSQFLKQRQKRLARRVQKVRPFNPDALADLIVVGTDLFEDLLPPEIEEQDDDEGIDLYSTQDTERPKQPERKVVVIGGTDQSFFMCSPPTAKNPNLHSVEVANGGSCSVTLTWRFEGESAQASTPFSILNASGILAPGESFSTTFTYNPDPLDKTQRGLSVAHVVLITEPKIPEFGEAGPRILLNGMLTESDKGLRYRQRTQAMISEMVIPAILEDEVKKMVVRVKEREPEPKMHPRLFYRTNRSHRFFYTPEVLQEFRALASEVLAAQTRKVRNCAVWDFSVDMLRQWISQIPKRRAQLIPEFTKRCDELTRRAKIEPPPNPVSFKIVKTLFGPLCRALPKVARDKALEHDVPLSITDKERNPHAGLLPYDPDAELESEKDEKKEDRKEEQGRRGGRKENSRDKKELTAEEKAKAEEEAAKLEAERLEKEKQHAEEKKILDAKKDAARDVICKEIASRMSALSKHWLLNCEGNEPAQKALYEAAEKRAARSLYSMWWAGKGAQATSKGLVVPLLREEKVGILTAAAGTDYCCAVLDDDRVYVWGGGKSQEAEDGKEESKKEEEKKEEEKKVDTNEGEDVGGNEPQEEKKITVPLPALSLAERLWGLELQQISLGSEGRILGIDDKGNLWEAKRKEGQELGDFSVAKVKVEKEVVKEVEVEGEAGEKKEEAKKAEEEAEKPKELVPVKVSSVTASSGSDLAFVHESSSCSLYSWGGVAGLGYELEGAAERQEKPKPIPAPENISEGFVQVSSGRAHALAVDAKGTVFAWGAGEKFQLGIADKKPKAISAPTVVPFEPPAPIRKVCCGSDFSMALSTEGKLYVWGDGESGVLAKEDGKETPTPAILPGFEETKVLDIAAGANHALALTEEGVWSWGKGFSGALGHGGVDDQITPKLIESSRKILVEHLIAGGPHTIILGRPKDPPSAEETKTEDSKQGE